MKEMFIRVAATALCFAAGVVVMPFTPFFMAWVGWRYDGRRRRAR